jgi:predicted dehydrogenase
MALAGQEAEPRGRLQFRYSVPHAFAEWEELLNLDGLDAISVAVHIFLHAPIANAALSRGIHVLSEKPLARNAEEGAKMVAAARITGRVLDVAFNHRRRGDIRELRKNLLGDPKVESVSASTHSELGPRGLGSGGPDIPRPSPVTYSKLRTSPRPFCAWKADEPSSLRPIGPAIRKRLTSWTSWSMEPMAARR